MDFGLTLRTPAYHDVGDMFTHLQEGSVDGHGEGQLVEEETTVSEARASQDGVELQKVKIRSAAASWPSIQLQLFPPVPDSRQCNSNLASVSGKLGSELCRSRSTDFDDKGGTVMAASSSICAMRNVGDSKRELDQTASTETDHQIFTERPATSRASCEEENDMSARKKLKLSREQSAILEESFKQHNTLTPKHKQALAKLLTIRPRQVEVWFQNRRARTKSKQVEVDYEYLKQCFDALSDENRRLQKELLEFKASMMTASTGSYLSKAPATTLTMCPSCPRMPNTSTMQTFVASDTAKNGVLHATPALDLLLRLK